MKIVMIMKMVISHNNDNGDDNEDDDDNEDSNDNEDDDVETYLGRARIILSRKWVGFPKKPRSPHWHKKITIIRMKEKNHNY